MDGFCAMKRRFRQSDLKAYMKMKCLALILSIALLSSLCLPAQTQPPKSEPTSAREAATQNKQTKSLTPGEQSAYDALVAKLPPGEQAWEKTLQQNLGRFYFPIHQKDRIAGKVTAWSFVKDTPGLPRVLIIGDSISRGYTTAVSRALAGVANVHRAPANCGPTKAGLEKLDIWLNGEKWDYITMNFGIHDRNTQPEEYQANLEALAKRLQQTGAKVIWVRTTPAPEGPNNEKFIASQCDQVNKIADEVMRKQNIPLVDLHGLVLPRIAELQLPNNVHFNGTGYEVMGGEVAKAIREKIAANKAQ